jgi:diketogulonate reductase-like aldo/keto reductase
MEYATLVSGDKMPLIGLGTWMLRGAACTDVVGRALSLGYRHIDTAEGYSNHAAVGEALAATDVAREDIFLVSKVMGHLSYDDVLAACETSLRDLQTDYLDLYLVHWPNPKIPMAETFQAFSRLHDEGVVRNIGVSNFFIHNLQEAEAASQTPIAVNQIEFHPFLNQAALLDYCQQRNIVMAAYSPLARQRFLDDPLMVEIAQEHGKTVAQVALRWLVNKGIVAIPKASSDAHLLENLDVFDWQLSAEATERLDNIERLLSMINGAYRQYFAH